MSHNNTWRYSALILLFSTAIGLLYGGSTQEKKEMVAMRLIGHKLLLLNSDSTSRVLPISRNENEYRIRFERDISFEPSALQQIVKDAVVNTEIASHYIVEVLSCDSQQVVYSYASADVLGEDANTCMGRPNPPECLEILFTLIATDDMGPLNGEYDLLANSEMEKEAAVPNRRGLYITLIFMLGIVLFFVLKSYFWRSSPDESADRFVRIGDYKFDKNNMELHHVNGMSELTAKESDLLSLLYENANDTLKRETILKDVWGNESEYIGRTLDVFISKLRKKLEADSSIKIVNIRGVGYKMILNR